MIHLFEGFLANTESVVTLPGTTRLNNEFDFSTLHVAGCFSASTPGKITHAAYPTFLATKTSVALQGQGNLTIGFRCKMEVTSVRGLSDYEGSVGVQAKKTDTLAFYNANRPAGHALPYLEVKGDIRGVVSAVVLDGVPIDVPGVSVYDEHFYELEYRISEGLVLVYIDNVEVHRRSADYSGLELGDYRAILYFVTRSYQSSRCNATISTVYAADERLGPVSVKRMVFSTDTERSADVLGPGGIAERLNDYELSADAVPYVEKDNQQFLLSASGLAGSEDIVAARVISTLSSEEQSALEAARPVSLIVSSAGQIEEGTPSVIPREGFETRMLYMPNNPFTNQPWTPSALQSMTYGVKFGVSE